MAHTGSDGQGHTRPRVLILYDYYLPGFKAGGPIPAIANLVASLGDDFEFRIATRDRDLGDRAPYHEIAADAWQACGKGRVQWLSPRRLSGLGILRLLRSVAWDVVYCNTTFSVPFTIWPLVWRRLGVARHRRVVVAPRGSMAPSALQIRPRRKRAFLRLAGALGLFREVVWQASSDVEVADIRRVVSSFALGDSPIVVAPDLPGIASTEPMTSRQAKRPGELRLVFLGRIARMKNLLGAVRVLRDVEGAVTLDVFGPVEDAAYWAECRAEIAKAGRGARVTYRGPVAPADVPGVLASHDVLFLPSLGENYGHAIVEALAAGCPVLISDRTPWRGLEEHRAGWDLPLEDVARFRAVIAKCRDMDAGEFGRWVDGARALAHGIRNDSSACQRSRELLRTAAKASAVT